MPYRRIIDAGAERLDGPGGADQPAPTSDSAFADYVHARLPVGPVPTVPEIRLHQAGPRSGLRGWAERSGATRPPYWSYPWGGGLVLARFLLDTPTYVTGRRVLDLGTGSGLVAIAAALAGASHVRAVDVDPDATRMANLNAALNGVAVWAETHDLTCGPPPDCDVVLVGDLFYAPGTAKHLAAFLDRCVAAGHMILVGDPGRAYLPRARLDSIWTAPTPDFGAGHTIAPSTVYRFRSDKAAIARSNLGRPAPTVARGTPDQQT